jgi:hypothetical protein
MLLTSPGKEIGNRYFFAGSGSLLSNFSFQNYEKNTSTQASLQQGCFT